jgi:hypothetical protein
MRLSFFRRRTKARPDDKPAPARAAEAAQAISAPGRVAEATSPPQMVSAWRKCIESLLASDGYVVLGSPQEMATGASTCMWGTDRPFQVSGEASYEDCLRQWRVYEEIRGEEMEPPPRPSARWHYYKLRALGPRAP